MERFELRECEQPVFLYKKAEMIEGIGECFFDNYGNRFICKDGQWYQVWHFAFHCTFLLGGARSYGWCWAPKYN